MVLHKRLVSTAARLLKHIIKWHGAAKALIQRQEQTTHYLQRSKRFCFCYCRLESPCEAEEAVLGNCLGDGQPGQLLSRGTLDLASAD